MKKKNKYNFCGALLSCSRAERRREFHLPLNGWPGSILSSSSLNPTAMNTALLEEMLFPVGEAPGSKPWEFQGTPGALLTLSCQDATPHTNTGACRSPRQPGLQPDLQSSGDSWRAFAPGGRSQAIERDEHCMEMTTALLTLNITPAPALAALPAPRPPR